MTLTVADDGDRPAGISQESAGMGLDIMRHRASLIHGTLTISSQPAKAREVICRVPAAAPTPGDEE